MTKHKHAAHVSEISVDKINAANSGCGGRRQPQSGRRTC